MGRPVERLRVHCRTGAPAVIAEELSQLRSSFRVSAAIFGFGPRSDGRRSSAPRHDRSPKALAYQMRRAHIKINRHFAAGRGELDHDVAPLRPLNG
jgi:hypothetical protein